MYVVWLDNLGDKNEINVISRNERKLNERTWITPDLEIAKKCRKVVD